MNSKVDYVVVIKQLTMVIVTKEAHAKNHAQQWEHGSVWAKQVIGHILGTSVCG